MDLAALDMREKIEQVEPLLPEDIKSPQVIKFDPSMLPIMSLAITGSSGEELYRTALDTVIPRLERIPGVARIEALGGEERIVSVTAHPEKLVLGISLNQAAAA